MKPTSTLIVCLLAGAAILGLPGKGSAETVDSAALESSIRRDLNEVISKIVDPGQFHVGVLSDVETNPERVIVEGESRSRIPAPQAKKKSPPPNMPGFDVDEEEEDTSSARDTNDDSWERQTFKTVDRNRIKAVLVHVSLDSGLSPALKEQVTRLIEDYTTLLPNKTRLKISFAPFKSNSIDPSVVPASRSLDQMNQNLKTVLAAIAGLFLAVLLLFALFGWILPARKERQLARRTAAERESAQAALTTLPARGIRSEPQASAIEVEERKAVLLSRFINDGYWFAKFHRSLDENGMQKLHQLVGGPAFSNLVSRFGLEAPESNGGEELSLTEKSEALARFSTDFSEFINLEKWNEHQFFGFLPNMSADSIVTLIRSIPKLDAAVMIKTLDAGRCAEVLGLMEEPELEVVLSMLPETSRLDTKALDEIEQRTRTSRSSFRAPLGTSPSARRRSSKPS